MYVNRRSNSVSPVTSAVMMMMTIVLLFRAPPTIAQDISCPTPVGVILQDSSLQEHFDKYPGCNLLDGNINFGYQDCSVSCEITTFSPLSSVFTINGSISIQCCNFLVDISGFSSLRNLLGSLVIYYNNRISTISGFPELRTVQGSMTTAQNSKLTTVSGFSKLARIDGYLSIENNPFLVNMAGLNRLETIRGNEIISGHALSLLYNTNLMSLSSLSGIINISYGTVHIEGNTALCYAGYPIWSYGSYPPRSSGLDRSADKGVDWRTKLSGVEAWQFTWGVVGEEGSPTLLVQNNAPIGSCSAATCHSSCPLNAGCLGPDDPALCGSCDPIGTFEPCASEPTNAPRPNIGVAVGVTVGVLALVLAVIGGVGVWGCVIFSRKWKDGRMGSFDISVGGLESTDFNVGGLESTDFNREKRTNHFLSGFKNSDMIASYSAPSKSVIVGGYVGANKHAVENTDYSEKTKKQDDINSTHNTGHPRSRSASSGRGNERTSKQETSSTEKLLSSSRDRPITGAYSQNENDEVDGSKHGLNGERRGLMMKQASTTSSSGEPSVEDILKKIREEEGELPMNFPTEQVKLGKEIGRGDFGRVLQAEARKLFPGQKKTVVVVKQLKLGATKKERDTFLRPVDAMKMLQHPNVLSLMGVVSQGPSLLVMLEYCSKGNFKTFLITRRRDITLLKTSGQLLKMACDMALGLNYLHTKSIAHNDFAARSCLVTGEGRVKLGDYGITRQTFKEDYYTRSPTQKAWPIRWMAPEQIMVQGRRVLDSQPVSMPANIWSFGIALWEVCSFAQWPYDEMSNEEVIQTVITSGKCFLENPLGPNDSTAYLFSICEQCWQEPNLRPSMDEVAAMLKDPSLCKKKKRTSSLRQQSRAVGSSTTYSSRTLPSASASHRTTPSRNGISSGNSKTISRTELSRPKRPAPGKPVLVKPVPIKSVPVKLSRPTRPAPAKPVPETRYVDHTLATPSPALATPSPALATPLPVDVTSTGRNITSLSIPREDERMSSLEVDTTSPNDHRQEPQYSDREGGVDSFAGSTETSPDDNDDFILEPPDSFSESSLDDLDGVTPPPIQKKTGESLVIKFTPPSPATTSDDDDDIAETNNFIEGWGHRKQDTATGNILDKVEGTAKVKKPKKKKRFSKEYSLNLEEDGAKQKRNCKKRSSSSENLIFQDEGSECKLDHDKIPMGTNYQSSYSSHGTLGEKFIGATSRGENNGKDDTDDEQHSWDSYSSEDHVTVDKGSKVTSGRYYVNVLAVDDDHTPSSWSEEGSDEVDVVRNEGFGVVDYEDGSTL